MNIILYSSIASYVGVQANVWNWGIRFISKEQVATVREKSGNMNNSNKNFIIAVIFTMLQ